jgi:uncharacterized protein YjbI with pentapeptide repeats
MFFGELTTILYGSISLPVENFPVRAGSFTLSIWIVKSVPVLGLASLAFVRDNRARFDRSFCLPVTESQTRPDLREGIVKESLPRDILAPRLPKPLPSGKLEHLADGSEIVQVALSDADLDGRELSRLLFEQVLFRRIRLMQARLPGLRLYDVRCELCEFSGADIEGSRWRRVILRECRLMGSNLIEASCEDLLWRDCKADGAVLAGAQFNAARFERCSFQGASFEGADLSGVVFQDCDLTQANLSGANLDGADLRGSLLDGMRAGVQDLQGVTIDPQQAQQVVAVLGIRVRTVGE